MPLRRDPVVLPVILSAAVDQNFFNRSTAVVKILAVVWRLAFPAGSGGFGGFSRHIGGSDRFPGGSCQSGLCHLCLFSLRATADDRLLDAEPSPVAVVGPVPRDR